MNNTIHNEAKKVSFKTPIFALTIIALVLQYDLIFQIFTEPTLTEKVYNVLSLSPFILLLILSIVNPKRISPATILSISVICYVCFFSSVPYLLSEFLGFHLFDFITLVLLCIGTALTCASIITGTRNKIFTVATISMQIFCTIFPYFVNMASMDLSKIATGVISDLLFYSIVIIYVLKYNSLLHTDKENKSGNTGKRKKIISISSIIALVLAIASQIMGNIEQHYSYSYYYHDVSYYYRTEFSPEDIVQLVIFFLSVALFTMFFISLHKKINGKGPISATFICLALFFMVKAIWGSHTIIRSGYVYPYFLMNIFISLVFIYAAIMNIIKHLDSFSATVPFFMVLPTKIAHCILGFSYAFYDGRLDFANISLAIDSISWFLLFFLVTAYTKNAWLFAPKPKYVSPQSQLLQLKNKFDHGVISQEEYQAKRAEIINNL